MRDNLVLPFIFVKMVPKNIYYLNYLVCLLIDYSSDSCKFIDLIKMYFLCCTHFIYVYLHLSP